jgi:phosphoenolpyruvate carboxylase
LALTLDDTIGFLRGFMLFSLLANLAEARRGMTADPDATVVGAFALLAGRGVAREAAVGRLVHSA